MKRTILTIFSTIGIYFISQGQNIDALKVGGYKYAYELKLNSPSVEYKFIIKERTKSEIGFSGGDIYKISAEDESISVIDINKDIWGVFDGNSFYLNTINYTGNLYFSKGEIIGKYIYFQGVAPFNKKFMKEIGYDKDTYIPMYGVLGGVIGAGLAGSIEANRSASNSITMLLDIQTDKVICVSIEKLYEVFAEYPSFKREYFSNKESERENVIRKYLKHLSDNSTNFSLTDKDIEDQHENMLNTQVALLKNSLFKTDTNISYQTYYKEIEKFDSHPDVDDIKLVSEKYSNGKLKSIGLKAKHNIDVEGDYTNYSDYVKIGTWRHFYNNEQLKMLVDFDLKENMDGRLIKYDKDGNIKKQEEYKHGWKVK